MNNIISQKSNKKNKESFQIAHTVLNMAVELYTKISLRFSHSHTYKRSSHLSGNWTIPLKTIAHSGVEDLADDDRMHIGLLMRQKQWTSKDKNCYLKLISHYSH